MVCTYLSNALSILYCADIFLVQYLDEGCHSPSTFRGADCEAVNILLRVKTEVITGLEEAGPD